METQVCEYCWEVWFTGDHSYELSIATSVEIEKGLGIQESETNIQRSHWRMVKR